MRHHESRKPVWRSGIGRFLVGVLIVSMTISLASAQREAFPEPSKHGQDPYKAQVEQQKLHDWLVSELPKGVLDSPIRVMVTQADMDEVDRVDAANPGPTTVGLTKPLSRRVDFSRARANGRVRSFDDGMISPTADGGFVWAVALTSEGASALRVHLKNLPPVLRATLADRTWMSWPPRRPAWEWSWTGFAARCAGGPSCGRVLPEPPRSTSCCPAASRPPCTS